MFDVQPPNSTPPQRIILPGAGDTSSSPEQMTQRGPTLPEHIAARPTHLVPPPGRPRLTGASIPSVPRVAPPSSIKTNWRKDPAYKFLFVAIGVVLVASILFMLFAGSALASLFNSSGTGHTNAGGPGPAQGTMSTQPTFPVASGSTPTSQPTSVPTPQPSPTTAPTATPVPTQQPSPTPTQTPQLNVQIVNVPNQVNNNSTVPVGINASQPGVQVQLRIVYNTNPFNITVGPQTTDGNGNVTLSWNVRVQPFGHYQVLAYVTAIAQNQNGQQVSSQTKTVKVVVRGGGIFNG